MRFFNTAGPCRPELHYMLPATRRLPTVPGLVDRQSYFVIHGPRQTGKTTAILTLARELTASGRYASAVVSMEVGAPFKADPGAAELAILESWRQTAEWQLPTDLQPPDWPQAAAGSRMGTALRCPAR
ncbi:MAG: hypothetical protein FJ011_11465 [Chloroflexi bacterium]|nr:hypothetical protein [Chloroflexota bacterium]